jgi:hypothetical protein
VSTAGALRIESLHLQHCTRVGAMNRFNFVTPVFQGARRADWKAGLMANRFIGSLTLQHRTHRGPERSCRQRVSVLECGDGVFEVAALGEAVSAARFAILSAATAKAVTPKTPSPHSKTWRQIRRFWKASSASGPLSRLSEVGRVTPCAPSFARYESVVAAVGAERTACRTPFGLW